MRRDIRKSLDFGIDARYDVPRASGVSHEARRDLPESKHLETGH